MAPHGSRRLRIAAPVLAYAIDGVGRWFALIALPFATYAHSHSPLAVGAVLAAPQLAAVGSPLLIAWGEARLRRAPAAPLLAADGLALAALAVALWRFALPAVLALAAVDGALYYATRGAVRALANAAAKGDGAPAGGAHKANAALNAALAVATVAGPAAAGGLFALVGGAATVGAEGLISLGCAALLRGAGSAHQRGGETTVERLRDLFVALRATPKLGLVIGLELAAVACFTAAIPAEILFVKHTLHAGASGYGAFVAVWGAGMIASSVGFWRIGGPAGEGRDLLGSLVALGTAAVGSAFLGLWASPSFALACLAAFVGGLGNGVQWAALIGVLQEQVEPALAARWFGAIEAATALAPIAGYLAGGALVAAVAPRAALLALGLGGLGAGLAFLPAVRVVRRPVLPAASREPTAVAELKSVCRTTVTGVGTSRDGR